MKHIIEQINIQEPKTGEKNGKKWTLYPIGLKIKGKWYNGAAFGNDVETYKELKEGQEFECELYQEERNGYVNDKFKVMSQKEKKETELLNVINDIKEAIKIMNKKIDELTKNNK